MNKKILLAGVITVFVLAGCQNVEDQIGSKLAEGIINSASNGEVKVSIDDLQNGKINVTTKDGTMSIDGSDNGGSMKITDKEGKTSTITSSEGETRPAGAPSDLPSPDGARDFNSFSYDSMTSLTYALDGEDLSGNCAKIQGLVESAGWTVDKDGFNFETSDSISKNYANNEAKLSVMCGLNDGQTTIGLQKTMIEQ